ncbi:MAG: formimidoylglutamate deiminase [Gammaproteobacteria bacterium]|nr:formimidoylglutamate deiminase [Gammaproteobacteria bacterium]
MENTFIVDCALLPQGWTDSVMVTIDNDGNISEVRAGAESEGEHVPGCLLPGVPNLHSHAHQRAMAGLAERSGDSNDNFWSWREVMYHYVSRIQPHHLQAIATQLYLEMLKAGYTSVAEFQYLHHDPYGRPYDNVAEMSLHTLAAAREVGIGITNLPVLYCYGGFGAQQPTEGQCRFINDAERFLAIVHKLIEACADDPNVATGIAPHSLRAISKEVVHKVFEEFNARSTGPIHIHIAEQIKEIEDCLAWCGQRPVEWLYQNLDIDDRWCLVHATHMTERETKTVADSGAVVGLCPTTEANLGDGLFNLTQYVAKDGRIGVGSDSQISVSPVEELRWLEYGQRLKHTRRNLLSADTGQSSGRRLFDLAVAGGAQACGRKIGRIETGYRADMIVVENDHPILYGRHKDALLDSWIFSGNENLVRDVYTGGRLVVKDGRHINEEHINANFRRALADLSE